jgi:glutamyl-tRNA synthetase
VSSIFNEVVQKWEKQGLIKKSDQYDNAYLKTIIGLLKDRVKKVNDIAHQADYFFEDPREYDAKAVKKHFKGESSMVLKHLAEKLGTLTVFDQISLEKVYREMADELNLSAGKLIHPTRLAISGVSVGPGLFEMMEVLGKEKVINRINRAVLWLEPKKE